jgi:3-deoxy-D-manno-octulosonate 8-phosphate phosphatase (KDO 8-P phosphatase)
MHNCDKEWFINSVNNTDLVEKLKHISLIITDVDGCLTDGTANYSLDKEITKGFSIQDGFLMAKCNKPGMPYIAFISGRSDIAAAKRASALGVPDNLYYQGIDKNKSTVILEIQKQLSLTKKNTLSFGDDILDMETKGVVSLFAAPSNAIFYVIDNADIVVPKPGGNGSLRLLLDLILYVQNKHIAQEQISKSIQ